jgi:hypothetical protein
MADGEGGAEGERKRRLCRVGAPAGWLGGKLQRAAAVQGLGAGDAVWGGRGG